MNPKVWLVSGASAEARREAIDKIVDAMDDEDDDQSVSVLSFLRDDKQTDEFWRNATTNTLRALAPNTIVVLEVPLAPKPLRHAASFWMNTDTKKLTKNVGASPGR